jgi:two-component system, chemotaxis family, protein-glutamate methylesterase/glutaminase
MIEVLIVDDSPVARQLLGHILGGDRDLRVIGSAGSGEEALRFIALHQPQAITMDVEMPGMNGFEVTRRIMATHPIPIVIITASYKPEMISKAFEAMEAGALAILEKPCGIRHPDYGRQAAEIIQTVKLMAEIKLVKRTAGLKADKPPVPPAWKATRPPASGDIALIAVGASTGGPQVLEAILAGLPGFQIPLVIVQHIAPGFLPGLVDWLNQKSGPRLSIARDGEPILPGHAYMIPNGFQIEVTPSLTLSLRQDRIKQAFCPSVNGLFRSVANACGARAAGVLLTGMGNDGAEGLKLMRDKGALTVAQDETSSTIYGMPGEAVKLGAAEHILPPAGIIKLLAGLSRRSTP